MIVSELSDLASRLSLGPIHRFGRLAVVPLIDRTAKPSGWLTLDAALAGGEVEVTEVSESGSVPELCLLNRSSFPVFLLDGEELVGAKQNRILNLSILVPAASNFEGPVSCVEQGRWSWRSRGFQSAGRVIYSKLRRSNAEAVSQSLFKTGSRRGDQGGVWDSIAAKSERMEVHSDTSAASALFETYHVELDEFMAGIEVLPGQVGAAFLLDDRFAGLDLLGGPDLLEQLLPKIVRSYALDALDDDRPGQNDGSVTGRDDAASSRAVSEAIEELSQIQASRHGALGLGEDIRLRSGRLIGAGIVADGAIAHLGLWAHDYH